LEAVTGISGIGPAGSARSGSAPSLSLVTEWWEWLGSEPYTVGIEEEVMILDPSDWSLAQRSDHVLAQLSPSLAAHAAAETHEAAIELATLPHESAPGATQEAGELRTRLAREIGGAGLRAASAGTHPFAVWTETRVSSGARYQLVYESMRELARREPTFALHVHLGMPDPEMATELLNRLRSHVPLLLALSANSPFWQGRDSGFSSVRTPIFQAFPRVGIPRAFHSYDEYVEVVDQLMRCNAFPEPTFLWWDVRLQPTLGTVELRVMDAQATPARTAVLVAAVQTIAHLELQEGFHSERLIHAQELLEENRFLAARDGVDAELLDPAAERRVSARKLLEELVAAGLPHAQELGCADEFIQLPQLVRDDSASWQRSIARRGDLPEVVEELSAVFADDDTV
jgi:carboxylate-amine ligase